MTSGFNWPEFGEWNYWSPMEFSKNIVKSALERDLVETPGTKMNYNSGNSNLLSAIIQKVSSMKTVDFAHTHLFNPIGIKDVQWHEKQGICLGANGLKLKPTDMLKLGSLYLREGQWGSAQIVPKDWVVESTQSRFITYPSIGHYGYHWWSSEFMIEDTKPIFYYFALGLFGQFIIVVPAFKMVVVFLSENYSDTMKPMNYFRDYIITK
jgi:CubicO group peptidase (beta-lactamase class C family)